LGKLDAKEPIVRSSFGNVVQALSSLPSLFISGVTCYRPKRYKIASTLITSGALSYMRASHRFTTPRSSKSIQLVRPQGISSLRLHYARNACCRQQGIGLQVALYIRPEGRDKIIMHKISQWVLL